MKKFLSITLQVILIIFLISLAAMFFAIALTSYDESQPLVVKCMNSCESTYAKELATTCKIKCMDTYNKCENAK